MADRFLRASGNWSSTSVWSTSPGGAGGASVPGPNDVAIMPSNFTVTINQNVNCAAIIQAAGTITNTSYNVTLKSFYSYSSAARTINMGSGVWTINPDSNGSAFELEDSNLTLNAGSSLLVINATYSASPTSFATLSKTFNDVRINLGYNSSNSINLNLSGSPTFRSLDIRSVNSQAHYVNFDSGSTTTVNKLIAIGYDSSNKLTLRPYSGNATIDFTAGGSSYGQYVHAQVYADGAGVTKYIGASSTASGGTGWTTSNAPKLATLTDDFTGSSLGADWYDWSGGNLSVSGNKATINTGTAAGTYRGFNTAASHWDATGSASSVKIEYGSANANISAIFMWEYTQDKQVYLEISEGYAMLFTNYLSNWTWHGEIAHSDSYYYRLRESGGTVYAEYSTNGWTWNSIANTTPAFPLYSVKVQIYTSTSAPVLARNISFSKFNLLPPQPPTITTGTATNVHVNTASIVSNAITANPDGVEILERGVAYATTTNPTIGDSKETGSGSPFDVELTGLTENFTYFARAYATYSEGTVYGSQISFKTMGRPSVVLNTPADTGTVSDLRPELKFTGTDPDTNNITYQLQISSVSNFASTIIDVLSASSAGFTGASGSDTDPFFNGSQITYKLQQDLTRGLTYYWRVRGKDPAGSDTWGEWTSGRSFAVDPVVPTLTLSAVHTVTDSSAKANASVSFDGGATITERGVVWSTSPAPTTSDDKATSEGTTGSFSVDLTDLTGSTTYYVRAYATNSKGTAYSNEINFQTLAPIEPPSVTTGNATNITASTAKIAGTVTSDGTLTILERGICFSDSENPPTVDDHKVADLVNALGEYEVTLTGLDPETEYYYRAYAINSEGVGYGEVETFTTDEPYQPDVGDGYWTWSPGRSQATISRSQATPANASVNLSLADLGLEYGKTYTFSVGDIEHDNGEPSIVLQRMDDVTPITNTIAPNSSYTFIFDDDYTDWMLRFFVTGENAESEEITASFYELYLAEEPNFSEFVPFTPKGITEIRIANNELVDKRRGEVIQTIYDALHGESYYPFNIDTEGLGWLEIGDGFTITDPDNNSYFVVLWNSKITVDGGISENLYTETPDKTYTDYKRAGDVTKRIKNAQIIVDKQNQTIEAITSDMYEEGGYINEQFSQVYQDIESITTTVQGAGGVNLIRNSVMYAVDDEGVPENWEVTGSGTLKIEASPESRSAGGVSGNAFTLIDKTVAQRVEVKKDFEFIPEDQKTYYTLSLKVKKNTVGAAYIKLSNRNEEHQIDFPDQEEYYWASFDLPELLPQDAYFDIEIYSDADAELQVTDLMLSIGKYRHEWTQANGEIMNTSVSITEDGMTIRSAEFRNDYTRLTALGLEVHSKDAGGERVFGFNKDETNVTKLKADKQITMQPMRIVPINYDSYAGWGLVPARETD